jgi:hypothetical protein
LLVGSVDVATVITKGPLASGCAIRHSVWEEIPLDESLEANEDKLWALAALRRGHAIYSPSHATYVYLKGIAPLERVRRGRRERVAVFRATGLMATRLPDIAKDLAHAVFRSAPAAAWNHIASGVLEALLPAQAIQRRQSGAAERLALLNRICRCARCSRVRGV